MSIAINMDWIEEAVNRLARRAGCGYRADGPAATEPTALAALALVAWGRDEAARAACRWLLDVQADDGSLGIDATRRRPCWPTGWAVLAWLNELPSPACGGHRAAVGVGGEGCLHQVSPRHSAAARALDFLLSIAGRPVEHEPHDRSMFGHDTTLCGWPWVESTHSWVEPTAINVLALRQAGEGEHPRCREAIALLLDRQLSAGGWNYGNTTVLGNTLRPHVQPTGLALWALAGEPDVAAQVAPSIDYLQRSLPGVTAAASLSYGLIGLAAHGVRPAAAESWLTAAARRTLDGDGSPYKLALLLLAAAQCRVGNAHHNTIHLGGRCPPYLLCASPANAK